jgi:predicted nucleic-acid-binding protein
MREERKIVDANIILRCLLNDNKELAEKAREIIKFNIVEIPIEVLSEVVYVLSKTYMIDRKEIKVEIKNFFDNIICTIPHRNAVFNGLEIFAETKLDFVDCILIGYKNFENAEVFTFDKKLKKLLGE